VVAIDETGKPCWTMLKNGSTAMKAAYFGSVIHLARHRGEEKQIARSRSSKLQTFSDKKNAEGGIT